MERYDHSNNYSVKLLKKSDFNDMFGQYSINKMQILQCGFHSVLIIELINESNNIVILLYEYAEYNNEGKILCHRLMGLDNDYNIVNILNERVISVVGCVVSMTKEFSIIKSINYNDNEKILFTDFNDLIFKFQRKHPKYSFLCSLSKYPKNANCQSFVQCIWKYFNNNGLSRITYTK